LHWMLGSTLKGINGEDPVLTFVNSRMFYPAVAVLFVYRFVAFRQIGSARKKE
jgi:hypothetical protein